MARTLFTLVVCILAGLAGLLSPAAHADPATVLALAGADRDHDAGHALDYFPDPGHICDLACARDRFANDQYRHSEAATPNLGVTGSYWFRLPLDNNSGQQSWVAEFNAPYLDEILLYIVRADGRIETMRSGDMMPTRERPLEDRNLAFPLAMDRDERATLYFRVTNQGPVTVPLEIKTREHFEDEAATENLAYGIYFGILAGVALYNLIIYFIMRDRSHMLYVLYAASFGIAMATVFGFGALFLWPESPWWINRAVPSSILVTGAFVTLFSRSFLKLPRDSTNDRVMRGILVAMVLLMPVGLFAPFGIAVKTIYVTSVCCVIWLLYLGIAEVARGNLSARFFMLAWVVLLVSVMLFLLTKLGVLPSTAVTEYGILIGSALEALLLSIALAHRFAIIRDESIRVQEEAKVALEQRVVERTRELDQALQARSEFLATVSHEIRTPMNGVLGITELMLDTELTPRQRDYAQIIQSSGRTLLTIINDVLDYSKIEAGKMSLENVPFRVHEVLKTSAQIFRAEAERKKLEFVTRIDPDVPPEIMGDPVRLQQVLNNLLSNAIKFTDSGEITLRVHREADGKLTFSVTDTGIGISTDIQPRLFEAFNQGDQSMTRRFGGTGLGLAISRRLVDLMGGSISFESDLGQGTTFFFTIPVHTVGSGSFARISAEGKLPGNAMHLLVVDDNAINLQVAAGLLRKLGHVVDTVDNGPAAIARLFAPGETYDAVFMDCEMPGMDGYAATREIRRRELQDARPPVPVVALTAHAFAEKITACRDAGMDDHLAKPLNARLLAQALERVRAMAGTPSRH